MKLNSITGEIVDAAYRVHRALGPGLLESVYEVIVSAELRKRGIDVKRQEPISISYDGLEFDVGFRADLLVEGLVIVEIKSVDVVTPIHKKQLLTYPRFADKQVGLLMNFNVMLMKQGITRVVNGLAG